MNYTWDINENVRKICDAYDALEIMLSDGDFQDAEYHHQALGYLE
jgi:hypothetical protein